MSNKSQNLINEFLQTFAESAARTFSQFLDGENRKKIKISTESSIGISPDINLEENNAIYKLDYSTTKHPGKLIVFIPEEFISSISDIMTGGSGEGTYKGSLSEMEVNSILTLLANTFQTIEKDFKHNYEHDIAFNTHQKLLLKEMPEHKINLDTTFFNLLVTHTLTLNGEKEFKINSLLNLNALVETMNFLGMTKTALPKKRTNTPASNLQLLSDVKINIIAQLGKAQVPIKYALELVKGSLIELDTLNNTDIKVFANGVEFARAQVVAIEDTFGLKITKMKSKDGFRRGSDLGIEFPNLPIGNSPSQASGQSKKNIGMTIPIKPIDINAFKEKMKPKLYNLSEEIIAADKELGFDEIRAERMAICAVQIGHLLNLSDKELEELWLAAYYHNIGRIKLKKSDFDAEDFKFKQAQESYDIILAKKMPEVIAETAKFCIDNYKSSNFNLNKPVPYSHIVSVVSYWEDLIERKQPREKVLAKMLQIGANKFNPFVLHKFIRIMKETNN